MNPAELELLEAELGLKLPVEYRRALLDYPLPRDPHSTELWLCDDVTVLREVNRTWRQAGQPSALVVIGSDGGEESYVLDTGAAPYPVRTYSVETDRLEPLAPSFNDFLERQRQEFEAVALEDLRTLRRTLGVLRE